MSQSFKINKKGEIIYFTVQRFDKSNKVIHGFSTRHGGISLDPYASLNLGFQTGDEQTVVQENKQRFCAALALNPAEVVTGQQIHSDCVQVVTQQDAGRIFPATDALITRDKVALMAFYADCVPILLYDTKTPAVGVVHSGWQGTVHQIGAKAVQAMTREFGSTPADCLVGIGPAIGPCCYEVDERVITEVQRVFPYWQDLVEEKENGRWNLDLWEACRQSLIKVGVPAENIMLSGMCTKCNQELLFSHRGEKGTTGRLAAVIRLK